MPSYPCLPILSLLFVSIPFMPMLIGEDDAAAGYLAGREAAQERIDADAWVIAGFCLGVVPVALGYVYPVDVPSNLLLGRSPEYVVTFIRAYEETARDIRTKRAATGCLMGAIASLLLFMFDVIPLPETTS